MLTGETLSANGLLQLNAKMLSEDEMKTTQRKDSEGSLIVRMAIDSSMPEAAEGFITATNYVINDWQGAVADGVFTEDHSEGALYYPFGNLSEGYESVKPLEYVIEMKTDENGVLKSSTLTYSIKAGNGNQETVLSQKFLIQYYSSKEWGKEDGFDVLMNQAVENMNAALIDRYSPAES